MAGLMLPLLTGPNEPSQMRPTINDLRNSVNSLLAYLLDQRQIWLFNVMRFGAVGDGVTDDSAAINAAFATLRSMTTPNNSNAVALRVYFPDGYSFLVKTTINGTSIRNIGWGIEGAGKIIGQTNGQPVLDLTNARYCVARGLKIFGDSTLTPNVGILTAVNSTFQVSDVHYFDGCSITGSFTVANFYNYGSEDTTAIRLVAYNDYNSASARCIIATGYNSLGITSPYETITASAAVSFNDFYGAHGDFRKTVTGTPVWIERAGGLALVSSYAVSYDAAAIILHTPADNVDCIFPHLDVHCEPATFLVSAVEFTRANAGTTTIKGLYFSDYYATAKTQIFKAGTNATLVVMVDYDIHVAFGANPSIGVFNDPAKFALKGGTIYVSDETYFNTPSVFWGQLTTSLRSSYIPAQYTVAALPTGLVVGETTYATNGRKGGEGAGSGTGVPVYWDGVGGTWKTFYGNIAVTA